MSLLVIVLSVATFCVESMDTKKKYKIVFDSLEYFYCIVFTLELVARFATCPNRVKFFKEAMTWVDILSIMPLYIRFAEPDTKLDFLFVLRLVRIFRLFRFFRTMSGMQVIGHTLRASARELFLLVLILLIPMVIFSTLVFYAEQSTEALTEVCAQIQKLFCLSIIDKARLVIKLASFFIIYFCSLSILLVGLDPAQNTKGVEMQMNN